MVAIHSEQTFEEAIEAHLLANGYVKGAKADYDLTVALDRAQILAFVQDTQPKEWARLVAVHGATVEDKVIARLAKEIDARGTLDVLRRGITDYGVKVAMAYFRPATKLAPETLERYTKNRVSVTRQLRYSPTHHNELDLALFVNGLPVATAELKTPLTGQTVKHAIAQYRGDRDPRDLLLQPKKRALVHFAVDPDEVYMTTRLAGEKTTFLPFNRGRGTGAGNPDNPSGYKTAYLWEEVWQRDSLLDLLSRFLHVEKGDATAAGGASDAVIFPRYHQLDVVRKIEGHAKAHGVGRSYLIQHSAGSGKSNSIAWLAHRLSSLHNDDDKPVFDTIIVITDRRVLDKQLQDTIFQFEHKQGVVEKIDQDSAQLASALTGGRRIIITTLQKFPFVLDKVTGLAGKRFGVIIDEAHSSQTGESAKSLKAVLTAPGADDRAALEAAARADEAAATAEEDAEDEIARSVAARGRQPNLSFFAFTATPKKKTLELFGTPGVDGKPTPFHLYAMRQAIEERFILDVLKHYVTYKLYYKLEKARRDDPEVDVGKAGAAIARFVHFHPRNLAQKSEVIIEHFRRFTRHKIGGRAKAMVVTSSRLHAVRYKDVFDAHIKEKGYTDIRTLVAFSGKVIDEEKANAEYTEAGMNGFGEKALPERFATNEYQVLIVAEKYQTGFDEPLLHTMYVDKKLDGVKAVQTLSRLNRTCPGKDDTLVLDFVNDPADIQAAFRPYYEETVIDEPTDPNLLYDLKAKLDGTGVYDDAEVDAFAIAFFTPETLRNSATQRGLFAALDPAVARYKALEKEEAREQFKSTLVSFTRLYAFLSQIIAFGDPALEKLYAYGRFLLKRLPVRADEDEGDLTLDDSVELEYYRLRKVNEGSIAYTVDNVLVTGPTEVGTGGKDRVLMAPLSTIVALLNKRFGTEFTDADRLVFDQIEEELVAKEHIVDQARENTLENFGLGAINGEFTAAIIDRRAQNEDIFMRLLGDEEFAAIVKAYITKKVYDRINSAA